MEAPKGLVINFDYDNCPDPSYVDDIQGGVTPSGLLYLSLFFDCPDLPKMLKSKATSISEEGNVNFSMPDLPTYGTEEGFVTFTRRIGANVVMPKHAARRLLAWLSEQLGESE